MRALALLLVVVSACGSSSEDGASAAKDAAVDVSVDAASDAAGDGGIDCSRVGCAAPPLCSTGCTEPCGCCSCSDGTTMGGLVCMGGCWVPTDAGGD